MSTISASTTSTTAYKVTADTTGTLVLQTGASPTTAVTIDTSQNVGIGTSSPSGRLHLKAASDASCVQTWETQGTTAQQWKWFVSGGAGGGAFYLQDATASVNRLTVDTNGMMGINVIPGAWTSAAGKGLQINNVGNTIWANGAGSVTTSANATYDSGWKYTNTSGSAARFDCGNGNGSFSWGLASGSGKTAGDALTWTTVATLQNGTYGGAQLLLNTASAGNAGSSSLLTGSRLSVGVIPYSASAFGCMRIQDTNGGSYFKSEWGIVTDGAGQPYTSISYQTGMYLVTGDNGTSAKIYFDSSGNASKTSGAGSWLALSDSRIKTNVQPVTGGLSRILQLNPVTFDYKSPEAHNGKVHDKGFIADDFMQVYPDSVHETDFVGDEDKQYIEEGSKAKAMGFNAEFYADLVSAIKEQQAIIEQQAAAIAALKEKVGI